MGAVPGAPGWWASWDGKDLLASLKALSLQNGKNVEEQSRYFLYSHFEEPPSRVWGCSSVVERMLCMYEAPGSIPGISTFSPTIIFFPLWITVTRPEGKAGKRTQIPRISWLKKGAPLERAALVKRPWSQSQMPTSPPLEIAIQVSSGLRFQTDTPSDSCHQAVRKHWISKEGFATGHTFRDS